MPTIAWLDIQVTMKDCKAPEMDMQCPTIF